MGNSCKRCFGIHRNNVKYIRSDLTQSRDLSIEFENLMTNDYYDELSVATQKGAPFTVASYMKWLSDQERSFMEDDDDESKNVIGPSNFPQPNKPNNNTLHLIKENDVLSNQIHRNWCTFGDEADIANNCRLSDDQLTGYFLDELSRDIEIAHDINDPNKPIVYEEEEIDGPELARLIRKMRPRDLFLTGGSRDLLTAAHSSIFIGNSATINDRESSHLSTLYTKIHQNLMKGIGDIHSAATSDRDQSSIDLDWDHEPGMNPSLALVHKRTDTEEDLITKLNNDGFKNNQYSYQSIINSVNCPLKPDLICQQQNSSSSSSLLSHNKSNLAVQPLNGIIINRETSVLSPDQLYYNEELAWDLEGEIFSDDMINGDEDDDNRMVTSYASTIVTSDKCHLLEN